MKQPSREQKIASWSPKMLGGTWESTGQRGHGGNEAVEKYQPKGYWCAVERVVRQDGGKSAGEVWGDDSARWPDASLLAEWRRGFSWFLSAAVNQVSSVVARNKHDENVLGMSRSVLWNMLWDGMIFKKVRRYATRPNHVVYFERQSASLVRIGRLSEHAERAICVHSPSRSASCVWLEAKTQLILNKIWMAVRGRGSYRERFLEVSYSVSLSLSVLQELLHRLLLVWPLIILPAMLLPSFPSWRPLVWAPPGWRRPLRRWRWGWEFAFFFEVLLTIFA